MSDRNDGRVWVEGFYPPDMDKEGGWEFWRHSWTMQSMKRRDWIWFHGDWLDEQNCRNLLKAKTDAFRAARIKRMKS